MPGSIFGVLVNAHASTTSTTSFVASKTKYDGDMLFAERILALVLA